MPIYTYKEYMKRNAWEKLSDGEKKSLFLIHNVTNKKEYIEYVKSFY